MVVLVSIAVMTMYGFLMGRKVTWSTFLLVSSSIMIVLSVLVAALNEAVDPGDGSFLGTVIGSILLFVTWGSLGILGFAAARYGVQK